MAMASAVIRKMTPAAIIEALRAKSFLVPWSVGVGACEAFNVLAAKTALTACAEVVPALESVTEPLAFGVALKRVAPLFGMKVKVCPADEDAEPTSWLLPPIPPIEPDAPLGIGSPAEVFMPKLPCHVPKTLMNKMPK